MAGPGMQLAGCPDKSKASRLQSFKVSTSNLSLCDFNSKTLKT